MSKKKCFLLLHLVKLVSGTNTRIWNTKYYDAI